MHQYHAEEHKAAEKNLVHRTAGSLCITDFHLLCWPSADSDAAVSRHIIFSHAKAGSLPMPWCATLPKWIFYMSQHHCNMDRTIWVTATPMVGNEYSTFPRTFWLNFPAHFHLSLFNDTSFHGNTEVSFILNVSGFLNVIHL